MADQIVLKQRKGNVDLDEINDVTLTTPASGEALTYNGSAWVNTDIVTEIEGAAFDQRVFDLVNDGTSDSFYIDQNGNGRGFVIDNAGNGISIDITHAGTNSALKINNSNTGDAIYIDQNGNGISLNIDSEATSVAGINVAMASTSYTGFHLSTGLMSFGVHSALSGETVSGYITIKDAGGTSRKVAVVT